LLSLSLMLSSSPYIYRSSRHFIAMNHNKLGITNILNTGYEVKKLTSLQMRLRTKHILKSYTHKKVQTFGSTCGQCNTKQRIIKARYIILTPKVEITLFKTHANTSHLDCDDTKPNQTKPASEVPMFIVCVIKRAKYTEKGFMLVNNRKLM
jgi:hypothetical protein